MISSKITPLGGRFARQQSPVNQSDGVRDLRPTALSNRQRLFNLDPVAVNQTIDDVFRAVSVEVIFRTSDANGYSAFAALIIDRIIDRFFEFSFERVGGASSDEDVIFRKTMKGDRMGKATIDDRIQQRK